MRRHPIQYVTSIFSKRWAKSALAMVGLVLGGTTVYTATLISQQHQVMRDISRYNVTWQTSQAAYEFARLQIAIGAYAAAVPEMDQDELQLRLDIVLNRVQLLSSGEMAGFLSTHPEQRDSVRLFREKLEQASGIIDHVSEPGGARHLLELLAPLNPAMAQLSAVAHNQSEVLMVGDLEKLDRLYRTLTAVLVLLMAFSMLLVLGLGHHNALLAAARDNVQLLLNDLQRSADALETAIREVRARNAVLQHRDSTLHTQNTRFTAALNNMSQALIMVDAEHRLIVANSRFATLFGLDPASMRPGTHVLKLSAGVRMAGRYGPALIGRVGAEQQRLIDDHRSGVFLREDAEGRALCISHQPMADGGWVATYEDITERRQAEAQIRYMAHHDALTNLPNRRTFYERLREELAGRRHDDEGIAVHCIDLDLFKHVNDKFGHPAGDALLEAAADRLRACVRAGDLVARLGGDEFAILQTSTNATLATLMAQRVVEAMREPYELGGSQVVVGASVGIAVNTGGEISAQKLFTNADLALYHAKEHGRNAFCLFEPGIEAAQQARNAMEIDLREGLRLAQLELFYQPIYSLEHECITGYEALLRWRSPGRGLVMPGEFIEIAEQTGLITAIGKWVLLQACKDAALWRVPVKVAINLSPVQFRDGELARSVGHALLTSGLSPDRLELEITESVLLQNDQTVLATMHELRKLGIRTVMDDFGAGYSSLSYLSSFPFDKIKVDQSFIRNMDTRPDALAIIESISGLARKLGMMTTAEGVETETQLTQLRKIGFDEVQGFLIGRPAPNDTIESLPPLPPILLSQYS